MNLCVFGGNLVRDPELRTVGANDNQVASFSIALRGFKKDAPATFVDCEAWNVTGEKITEFFHKGDFIIVFANARQDTWKDKDTGANRSKIKFVVDRFEFGGGGNKKTTKTEDVPESNSGGDEDIPF